MRQTPLVMGLSLLTLAGCADDTATKAAMATFDSFQDAVFARNAGAARDLVTGESRQVIDAMPWMEVTSRDRLIPVESIDQRGCYHIEVRDPNEDNALGYYVVVRERGKLVVDLVATAALAARPGPASTEPPQFELQDLKAIDSDKVEEFRRQGR